MSIIESHVDPSEMSQLQLLRELETMKQYGQRIEQKVQELLEDEEFIMDEIAGQKLWVEIGEIAKGNEDAAYALRKQLRGAAMETAKRTVEWDELED